MKPRDILLMRTQQYLCAPLAEFGFTFARSKLTFSRRVGIVTQKMWFQLDRWNSEDECSFWTHWLAESTAYLEWHEQHFETRPDYPMLGCEEDHNIPGWSTRFGDRACLHNDDNDAVVMQRLLDDCVRVGIPFLDSISSYEKAAEQRVKEKDWVAATDYFLLAGERDRAGETLLKGISEISTHDDEWDRTRKLPQLELRRTKFFGEETHSLPVAASPAEPAAEPDVVADWPECALLSPVSSIIFNPQTIAKELRAYGEPEAADKLLSLPSASLQAIGRRAHEISIEFEGGRGPMIVTAICLAVVEHVEGTRRPLRRKRRRFSKE